MKSLRWIAAGLFIVALLVIWMIATGKLWPRTADGAIPSGVRPDPKSKSDSAPPQRLQGHRERAETRTEVIRNSAGIVEAYSLIRAQGDYRALRNIMLDMSSNERFGIFYGEFLELNSRLGNGHDYSEKLAIISEFGENRTIDLKTKLLMATGKNLDPAGDKDFIMSLDHESWKTAVCGAALLNPNNAFDLASSDLGDDRQRIAFTEATKIWLGLDSIAASERISKMPKGVLRDAAISELVDWLAKKNEPESATAWIAEISDPTLRDNLAIELHKHH